MPATALLQARCHLASENRSYQPWGYWLEGSLAPSPPWCRPAAPPRSPRGTAGSPCTARPWCSPGSTCQWPCCMDGPGSPLGIGRTGSGHRYRLRGREERPHMETSSQSTLRHVSAALTTHLLLFSLSVLQHMDCSNEAPCPSPSPGVCPNSWPLSRWCHPTISSSVIPFSCVFNLSQHQNLFQWVGSSNQVVKVLEHQFQHQSCHWIFRVDLL